MMKTILYNGMELEEFNPDKSVSFNPPIKCVGWNKEDVKVEFELSSALSKDIWLHRFIGKTKDDTPVAFMFCARIQENESSEGGEVVIRFNFTKVSRKQLAKIAENAIKALADKRNFDTFTFTLDMDGDESDVEVIKEAK